MSTGYMISYTLDVFRDGEKLTAAMTFNDIA